MTVDELTRFAIFEGLTPEESATILRCCKVTSVKKGEKVLEAGESASSLFLVRSGRIEVRFKVVCLNASLDVPLDIIRAGEVCGWSALIPPHRYTLSAYATEDSELLQIQRTDLQEYCEANTRVGYMVMKNIARTLGDRYENALQMLIGGIQKDLKKKENKTLWKTD
jgi:CRP/FNR family transcriptional regulator, cyclic AMP receptor protein